MGGELRTVEIARLCVWTADLPQLMDCHDSMVVDVDELLVAGKRNYAGYGEQTATCLQEFTTSHWLKFFGEVRQVVSMICERSEGQLDEGTIHLRAWASKLSSGKYSERQFRLNALHNHSPAFISAVYYLRLSNGNAEGDGGTFFVNPITHPIASPHPGVVIAPAEGRLIAFPSWIMHGPLLVDPKPKSPRVIVGIDAHFIPK